MQHLQALIALLLSGHLLVAGPTGVGKNVFATQAMLDFRRRRISQTTILPHEAGWKLLFGEILAREVPSTAADIVPRRLIFEDVGEVSKVVMRPFVMYSTKANPLDQMMEDRLLEERALEAPIGRTTDTKLADTPAKEKYARLGIRLSQEARRNGAFIPESEIPNLLNRDHPIQEYALSFCRNADLLREFSVIRLLPLRDYLTMVESAIRFLEPVYRSASVIARTSLPPDFDWPEFFRQGGTHIITKGKASDEEFRTYCQADFLMKFRLAMDGLLPQHHYWIDEANNYGLINDFCAKAFSTSRYRKFFLCPMVQLLDFATEEIKNNVLSNCSNRTIFRQEDPELQEFFARDLRGMMDEYKQHHVDEDVRTVWDGWDEVQKVTKGRTKQADGKESETESLTTQLVARYREDRRLKPAYQGGNEQAWWLAQQLGELPVGSCFIKTRGQKPVRLDVPFLRDSWVFPGVADRKIDECLTQLYQRPPYQTPVLPQPSVGTTTPTPGNGTGKPTTFSKNGRRRRQS